MHECDSVSVILEREEREGSTLVKFTANLNRDWPILLNATYKMDVSRAKKRYDLKIHMQLALWLISVHVGRKEKPKKVEV